MSCIELHRVTLHKYWDVLACDDVFSELLWSVKCWLCDYVIWMCGILICIYVDGWDMNHMNLMRMFGYVCIVWIYTYVDLVMMLNLNLFVVHVHMGDLLMMWYMLLEHMWWMDDYVCTCNICTCCWCIEELYTCLYNWNNCINIGILSICVYLYNWWWFVYLKYRSVCIYLVMISNDVWLI